MNLKKICAATALTLAVSASLSAATINVFLLGGQSNMDGRANSAELSAALRTQTDVMFYSNSVSGGLTYLQPMTGATGDGIYQFGPEIAFGRSMADFYAGTGEQVALIKYAGSGQKLYSDWLPDGTASSAGDGPRYKDFQTTVTKGLAALAAAHPNDTIIISGMIWMQGESDAVATYDVLYQTNLTAFINDIRLTYNIADLPFIIGELSNNQTGTGSGAASKVWRDNVRAGQEAVAAADPFTGIVNTDSFQLKGDNLHFDATGQLQLGEAFALQMQALLIPEPSTWALMVSGAALLLMLRRRNLSE